jgi:hypothetical protein
VHVVSHPPGVSFDGVLHHLPRDRRLVEVHTPFILELCELPHEAGQALLGNLLGVPLTGRPVRKHPLLAPGRQGELCELPCQAQEPLLRRVLHLSLAEGRIRQGDLQAPGHHGDLHELSHTTERALRIEVLDVPQDRSVVEIRAPEFHIVRLMPQVAVRSLRYDVLELSLTLKVLEQRNVQSPERSRRRTHL